MCLLLTIFNTSLKKFKHKNNSLIFLTTFIKKENGVYYVEGEWLYNFMGQINFGDYESLNFFQRVLVKNGVIDLLRKEGIEEGDTVSIYDFEFDYVK